MSKDLDPQQQGGNQPDNLPNAAEILSRAIETYRLNPTDSAIITDFWKQFWLVALGENIDVPQCDRTKEELEEIRRQGRMLIYLPSNLSHDSDLPKLQKIFSPISPWYFRQESDIKIENQLEQHGWLDVEATPECPIPQPAPPNGFSFNQLKDLVETSDQLRGQTANTYTVSAVAIKLLTKRLPDYGIDDYGRETTTLLFGSILKQKGDRDCVPYVDSDGKRLTIAQYVPDPDRPGLIGIRTVRSPQRKQLAGR